MSIAEANSEKVLERRAFFHGSSIAGIFILGHVSTALFALIAVDIILHTRQVTSLRGLRGPIFALGFCATLEITISAFNPNGLQGALVSLFGYTAFAYGLILAKNKNSHHLFFLSGLIITTTTINLAGHFLGIQTAERYLASSQNGMGSILGFTTRVLFPFANGVNVYGTLVGLFLVISLVSFQAHRRALFLICAALSLLSLMMVDSRGALAIGLLCAVAMPLLQRVTSPRLLLLLSLLSLPTLLITGGWINEVFSAFARIGSDVTSGRITYWTTILDALAANPQSLVLGSGIFGTSYLGISLNNLSFFENYIISDIYPGPHNMWLTLVVDGGIFKLGTFIYIFWISLARSASRESPAYVVAICAISYCLLIGTIETTTEFVRFDFLFAAAFMLGTALRFGEAESLTRYPKNALTEPAGAHT